MSDLATLRQKLTPAQFEERMNRYMDKPAPKLPLHIRQNQHSSYNQSGPLPKQIEPKVHPVNNAKVMHSWHDYGATSGVSKAIKTPAKTGIFSSVGNIFKSGWTKFKSLFGRGRRMHKGSHKSFKPKVKRMGTGILAYGGKFQGTFAQPYGGKKASSKHLPTHAHHLLKKQGGRRRGGGVTFEDKSINSGAYVV
jgi:hypothetical protein